MPRGIAYLLAGEQVDDGSFLSDWAIAHEQLYAVWWFSMRIIWLRYWSGRHSFHRLVGSRFLGIVPCVGHSNEIFGHRGWSQFGQVSRSRLGIRVRKALPANTSMFRANHALK